jgi:hypothetical protein
MTLRRMDNGLIVVEDREAAKGFSGSASCAAESVIIGLAELLN